MRSAGHALVGRAAQLAQLAGDLRRPAGARGAVLVGEAGVGKTRLAWEAAGAYARAGHRVRWVTGTSSAREIPLGAFAEFVPDTDANPAQLLRRTAEVLVGREASGAQTLVCVDDAHDLDDLSAALLQQLTTRRRGPVLITVRSTEHPPEAVTALWAREVLPRRDVPLLSATDSLAMITGLLGGSVDERSVGRLAALARGNPLYLRQVVAGEQAGERLVQEENRWTWHGGFAPSAELVDLIDLRLRSLPAETLAVLDTVALAGPLPLTVLTRVTSADQVEGAEHAGAIEAYTSGSAMEIRPAHPLYAEARRARLARTTRRRLLGQVADVLADVEQTAHVTLRRARMLSGADRPADPLLLTNAARYAAQLLDWHLACELAEAAVRAGGGPPAEYILAHGMSFTLQTEAADAVFARLCDVPAFPVEQRTQLVMSRAANDFWFRRRPDLAVELLTGEIAVADDQPSTDALESMLALFEVCTGQVSEGLTRVRAVTRRGIPPSMGGLCAVWATTAGLGVLGRLGDQPSVALAIYEAAGQEFGLGQPRIGLLDHLVIALITAGRVAEAGAVADRLSDDIDHELLYPFHSVEVIRAHAALAAGQLSACRDHARRAVDWLGGRDDSGWVMQALVPLTTALAQLGELDAARTALERSEAERHPAHALLEPDLRIARAWTAAGGGALSSARSHARDAADWARDRDQPGSELCALQVALRFGDSGVAARVADLVPRVENDRAPIVLAYGRALAGEDGLALIRAAAAFEELGDLLTAADAAAQAAQAFGRSGRRGSQYAAVARTDRLARACGGPRTPAIAALMLPAPLTARESEVVALAGRGLNNRDIAAELTLSVRTVEGHLYRAAAKLGVRRRREFAQLISGSG